METRANYALIGLFTLAVVTAAFGFVFWFSGKDSGGKQASYRVVFTGSVTGLSRGGSVLYNGLRVGEVTSIQLLPNDPSKVVARIDVDANTPVNVDTRAQLVFQGLTGVAAIQLVGGQPGAARLTAEKEGELPVLHADRSDFQNLLESAQNLAKRADDVLAKADRLFSDNADSISRTVRNIESFSGALAANSDGVAKLLSSAGNAADRIAALSVDLQRLSDGVDQIVRAVEPADVRRILGNVRDVSETVAQERERISALIGDAGRLARTLTDSSQKLDGLLADASGVLKAVDPAKVGSVVDNANTFAQALGNNSGRVDEIVRNANELTAKLNRASDRLDGVLASAQKFLGSDATQGALADIGQMAKSVRALADNLDKRTAEITAGVSRVTGQGLRDFEQLASDGKRTLGELSRTLNSLQRNPQQLIFGSRPTIPDYSGRR